MEFTEKSPLGDAADLFPAAATSPPVATEKSGAPGGLSLKQCAICQAVIQKRADEAWTRYNGRRYCSPTCTGKGQTKNEPSKRCSRCGTIFLRKKGEAGSNWAERKYCSRECGSVSARGSRTVNAWQTSHNAQRRAIARQKGLLSSDVKFPGADSVEAYLAAGGQITRCPDRYCAPIIHEGVVGRGAAQGRVR